MSEEDNDKIKIDLLLKELGEYGYSKTNKISQNELILFLDLRTHSGKFDTHLSQKLFKILDMNEKKTISIEQFIKGYIQFEKEVEKIHEIKNKQYLEQKEKCQNLYAQCRRYQSETLNKEGFSDDAKLYGKIIDITLKKKLEGVKEIILKIVFSGQKKEIRQKLKKRIEIVKDNSNKEFEFKAKSKNEKLEFILQAKNDLRHIYTIGSKIFTLQGINTQDEFYTQIDIYENDNNNINNLIAVIMAKIRLNWSNFKLYDLQRRIEEPKLNKLKMDIEEAEDNITMVQDIYGEEEIDNNSDLSENKSESNFDENIRISKRSIISKRNSNYIDEDFKNKKIFQFSPNNYVVEFNNMRIDEVMNKGINVNFNNQFDDLIQEKSHISNDSKQSQNKDEKHEIYKNNEHSEKIEINENDEKIEIKENDEKRSKESNEKKENEEKNENNDNNEQIENEDNTGKVNIGKEEIIEKNDNNEQIENGGNIDKDNYIKNKDIIEKDQNNEQIENVDNIENRLNNKQIEKEEIIIKNENHEKIENEENVENNEHIENVDNLKQNENKEQIENEDNIKNNEEIENEDNIEQNENKDYIVKDADEEKEIEEIEDEDGDPQDGNEEKNIKEIEEQNLNINENINQNIYRNPNTKPLNVEQNIKQQKQINNSTISVNNNKPSFQQSSLPVYFLPPIYQSNFIPNSRVRVLPTIIKPRNISYSTVQQNNTGFSQVSKINPVSKSYQGNNHFNQQYQNVYGL